MAKFWFEKSKYNNSPMIVYKGSCNNCGCPFEAYEKGTIYTCCVFEKVECDVAIDLNKDKADCGYTNILQMNNGEVANDINLGMSYKEALAKYNKRFVKEMFVLEPHHVITFGKYCGKTLEEIPYDYLKFIDEKVKNYKINASYLNTRKNQG